jgi:hypothetical protein
LEDLRQLSLQSLASPKREDLYLPVNIRDIPGVNIIQEQKIELPEVM